MAHTYRIGIDVGGTFTDAVLLIDGTLELVGTVKVPTTHSSPFGVAEGISNALESLLQTYQIPSGAISFIAHGTTQATNALLEGDVAPVAIIATGDGAFSYKVRKETQFSSFPLADKKELKSSSYFLSSFNKEEVDKIIDNIIEKKIVTVVSATAYSVDTPFIEKAIKKMVSKKGLACTATHEMSGLYGLRTRTKTAVLNASILPKMVETTEFMKKSVISSGIHSPLMIMRSDGGVMSAAEVAHTPIQTILSGPAAGVRGAISYLDVQEGFFMEAGGTSTDISLIRNNDVLVRWAQIGSHKTYINSLDIHTVAVAGGSMLQRSGDTIKVGPRSAHIAGLEYLCFAENLDVDSLDIEEYISKNDVSPYITCVDRTTQKRYALTLTCIANVMGYTTKDDYCYSPHYERIMFVIKLLASFLGISADQVLQKVNDSVCSTIIPVLEELATTYQVDINNLPIVGGGGGCSSVVPLVAKIKNMKYLIGKNAHVISPIGVALSMVRESVERHIVDPSEEDLDDLRNIVVEKLVSTGVKRESISVEITTDPLKGIYKAVATGVNNNVMHQRDRKSISAGEINDIVREHANITPAVNIESDRCNDMIVASFRKKDTSFLKKIFFPSTRRIYVLSHTGQILYNTIHGEYRESAMGTITNDMKLLLDKYSEYGDMGERIPEVFIVISNKIVDYSMIRKRTELITMCNTISKGYDKDEKCIIILQL